MNKSMPTEELRRLAEEYLAERVRVQGEAGGPDVFGTARVIDCDGLTGSVLFSYETRPWMANVLGIVHGGIIATLLDSCMGLTCAVHIRGITPTVTMTVNYLRPLPLSGAVHVRTRLNHLGRTTAQAMAEIFFPDRPDDPLVTATGVYSTAAAK